MNFFGGKSTLLLVFKWLPESKNEVGDHLSVHILLASRLEKNQNKRNEIYSEWRVTLLKFDFESLNGYFWF